MLFFIRKSFVMAKLAESPLTFAPLKTNFLLNEDMRYLNLQIFLSNILKIVKLLFIFSGNCSFS